MIRATTEIGPNLPEQLLFSTGEAELSVRAIGYYVTSSLNTLQANWNVEGLHGMTDSPGMALERIDQVAQFIQRHRSLAEKFSSAVNRPQEPTELSTQELGALGESLFRMGNSGLVYARAAISKDVGFNTPADKTRTEARIWQTADDAYGLFKELEPIGQSKADIGWMIWDRKPSVAYAS